MMTPPSKKRMEIQQNFNLVLDVSIRLFNELGYDKTTMSKISAETGLSNGSIYHLFSGKDEILRQIYYRNINISLGLTQDMEQKALNPTACLIDFMLSTQQLWMNVGPMFLANKHRWATSRTTMGCSPIQREELLAFIAYGQSIGSISHKSDPATLVEFLFTLQRGILYGWMVRDDFDVRYYANAFWTPVMEALVKGTLVIGDLEPHH